MLKVTERQREVLTCIRDMKASQYAPTFRDIQEHLGISYEATRSHLLALKRKGVITWDPSVPRSIEILSPWQISTDS